MIKILVCSPIKADATSFYRAWGPLQHLSRQFEDIELIDVSIGNMELSWAVLKQGDILFLQRPSTSTEARIMEIARSCNIPIWIDYDDDYMNIPETNPRHELYAEPHRVEQIKRAIEFADMITVSTPAIKKSIMKVTGKPSLSIQVIPNGIDETLFDTVMPLVEEPESRDIIMWRGGDTHSADIDPYLEKMAQLYNEFPEYKWAFVGAAPEKFLKMIDTSRVLLYAWEDVFIYFDRLFDLKPKVTIVPWAKTEFNESKSNCSWLEATMAGSYVVFPRWSTEFINGSMAGYEDPESFYSCVKEHLTSDWSISNVRLSFSSMQKFLLRTLNKQRYTIAKTLVDNNTSTFGWRNPKYKVTSKQMTDEEFYRYVHEKQWIQDNDAYREAHYQVAQSLIDKYKPNSVVEIGCGPGAMLEYFLDKRIGQVVGFDINHYFKEYFDKRNPHYTANFVLGDIMESNPDGIFDLCVSIEVFEHIPSEQVDLMIEKLSHHFRYFYFSSTPYHTSKHFDRQWNHINLRTHEAWIASFEARGWLYEGNPQMITNWDMAFKSVRHGDVPVIEIGNNPVTL